MIIVILLNGKGLDRVHQTDFHAEDVIKDYWKALGTSMPDRKQSKRKLSTDVIGDR